jgi:tetratricopeptide (TPR) repeat protein
LTEADRYLVAAVALFARPVTPEAVLVVAEHPAFDGRLDGWNSARVEAAARGRLAGLLSWHPDGTLATHPLVREAFRPLALGAAHIAAEATLTDLPAGMIASQDHGLRLVEAIELLLTADEWQAADDLYRSRTGDGDAWHHLPAARLGQRAASAFVGTPTRRQACADRITPRIMGFYLNEVGLCALYGGDLVAGREYLGAALSHDRDVDDPTNLAVDLRNLTDCLCRLGEVEAALQTAEQAAAAAVRAYHREGIRNSAAYRGWALMLAGDTPAAEEAFLAADRIEQADDPSSPHLYSLRGTQWGEFLARTGRVDPARRLTDRNYDISTRYGWNTDAAMCDRLLGRLDLAAGNPTGAEKRLSAAVATFRAGDYLVDMAETLPLIAESARVTGDLAAAERHIAEALTLAGPRGLVLAQAAALATRASVFADRTGAGDRTCLERGRDAADTARRLAIRHRLAWHELDALDAHAHLDAAEGVDRGWAAHAARLRARLIPIDLDPDPLATVEREIADERARAAGPATG